MQSGNKIVNIQIGSVSSLRAADVILYSALDQNSNLGKLSTLWLLLCLGSVPFGFAPAIVKNLANS